MALFLKKTTPISNPRYEIGAQETALIIGLGNPGKEYDNTRHNFGFMALDYFAEKEEFNPWVEKKDLRATLCAKILNGKKVILCKPTTYMNDSGVAVRALMDYYKIPMSNVCVVHDELDLDNGTIKTQRGGGPAGHNGVASIHAHSGKDFWRIRLGIGPKHPTEIDTADFVLQRFSASDAERTKEVCAETTNLLVDWLATGGSTDTRRL